MDTVFVAFMLTTVLVPSLTLRVSTRGSTLTATEHATDLVLRCHVSTLHSEDELTRVTWYSLDPITAAAQEIISVDLTGEHQSFAFSSAKWAGRGLVQPIREGDTSVSIVLPARFVSRGYQGKYRCHMRSLYSTGFEDVTVSVYFGPGTSLVITPGGHVQREEGVELHLLCSAHCVPGCDYRWYKSGRMISGQNLLHISSVSREDAGLYACQAWNLVGRSIKPVDVRVRFDPVVTALSMRIANTTMSSRVTSQSHSTVTSTADFPKALTDLAGLEKSPWRFTVTLACNVSGWPDPMVVWGRDRHTFGEDTSPASTSLGFRTIISRFSPYEKSSIAILSNATCLDSGQYFCSVSRNDNFSSPMHASSVSGSTRSLVVDLPCPPARIQEPMVTSILNRRETLTAQRRSDLLWPNETNESNQKLCQSSAEVTGNKDGTVVIVVGFNTSITVRVCLIGNPKPKLTFRRVKNFQSTGMFHLSNEANENINRSEKLRKSLFKSSIAPKMPDTGHVLSKRDDKNLKSTAGKTDFEGGRQEKVSHPEEQFNDRLFLNSDRNSLDEDNTLNAIDPPHSKTIITEFQLSTIECSKIRESNIYTCKIALFVTDPSQYGGYELVAKNAFGETRKRYQLISRQAPLPPQNFRLVNISADSACFSWRAEFHGGARQTFHLHRGQEPNQNGNESEPESLERQRKPGNVHIHDTVHSVNIPSISSEAKGVGQDKNHVYVHCLTMLSPSTSYAVTLYSSNRYGNSESAGTISLQTHRETAWLWKTSTPKLSVVSRKYDTTLSAPSSSTAWPGERTVVLRKSHASTAVPRTLRPQMTLFSEQDAVDEENLNKENYLHPENYELKNKIFDQDLHAEDYINVHDGATDDGQQQEDDYESDYFQELVFDEDDLIYGEINSIPFFQAFHAQIPTSKERSEENHQDTSAKSNHLKKNNDKLGGHIKPKKDRNSPNHLKKLIFRYSRPYSKLDMTKENINLEDSLLDHYPTTTPEMSFFLTDQPTSPVQRDIADKDLTAPHGTSRFELSIIFSVTSIVVLTSVISLSWLCMRARRRHRRLRRLKQKHQQRLAEENRVRRVEDRNVTINRLSNIRAPQPPGFTMASQPSGSLGHISPAVNTVPNHLERRSITCVSNKNAHCLPLSYFRENLPEPLRQPPGRKHVTSQRDLRPISGTPEDGKGADTSRKSEQVPRCSNAIFAVPTITVGEGCGADYSSVRLSSPSCPTLHPSDLPFPFGQNDLDLRSDRHDVDRLRPPSHHSSYSSLRQADLLFRMDSSSSGTTANYFNLYESLASKSFRSRSPSNIYDPLSFDMCTRSNPPSRSGSHLDLDAFVNKRHSDCNKSIRVKTDAGKKRKTGHTAQGFSESQGHDNYETDSENGYSGCFSVPVQTSNKSNKPFHTSLKDDTKIGKIDKEKKLSTTQLIPQGKSSGNNPVCFSDYEDIVSQTTQFSKNNKLHIQHNNFSLEPETSPKSFDFKTLLRLSLPRSPKEVAKSKISHSVSCSSNSLEMASIKNNTNNTSTVTLETVARCSNFSGKNKNCDPPLEPTKTLPRKFSCTPSAIPPLPNHETLNGFEEPIYVDIDANDATANDNSCKNSNINL